MYRIPTIFKSLKRWSSAMVLFGFLFFFSCNNNNNSGTSTIQGEWYQESSVDAGARGFAVTFTIADSVYIFSGFNGNNGRVFLNDLYVYVKKDDTWKARKVDPKKMAVPEPRSQAVAFTANGKGYVGLGYNGTKYLNDFWAYDPVVGTWTKVADFPGAARAGAVAFNINNKGYVGTGKDDNLHYKDFYQYDDETDKWIQKSSVPKVERAYAFSFVIGDKAYVGGGVNGALGVQEFCEYDPIASTWTLKNDLKDDNIDDDKNDKGYTISREMAVAFVIAEKAYVVGGKRGSSPSLENWEYSPQTDTWLKKNAFEGYAMSGSIGYAQDFNGAINGFIATGTNGSYFNDKWRFDPTQEDK